MFWLLSPLLSSFIRDTPRYPAYKKKERGNYADIIRISHIFIRYETIHYCMPDFGNPFAGLKENRKLTHDELVRAIRFMIAAEYEAIQLYQQLAESIDNKLAIEVLEDIADEEKVHAGEFLRLLYELDPKESDFYQEGADEVEEEIEKLRG